MYFYYSGPGCKVCNQWNISFGITVYITTSELSIKTEIVSLSDDMIITFQSLSFPSDYYSLTNGYLNAFPNSHHAVQLFVAFSLLAAPNSLCLLFPSALNAGNKFLTLCWKEVLFSGFYLVKQHAWWSTPLQLQTMHNKGLPHFCLGARTQAEVLKSYDYTLTNG